MAERMLETVAMAKRFGGLNALSGVDFHIDRGEIVSMGDKLGVTMTEICKSELVS